MKRATQIIVTVLIWAGIILAYYLFRVSQSSSGAAIQYLKYGSSIRPTTCSGLAATGFQGTLSGVFYFDGLQMRADITEVEDGVTTQLHALSTDGQTVYTWVDAKHGAQMTRTNFAAQFDFSKVPLDCAAWWRPDSSYFEMPAFTPFSQT